MNSTYKLQKELLDLSDKYTTPKNKRELATLEQIKKLNKIGFAKADNNGHKYSELSIKYPTMKIINRNAINEICSKYNLMIGDIDKFIGEIPKKNADEIIQNLNIIKKQYKSSTYSIKECIEQGYWTPITSNEFVNKYGEEKLNELLKNKRLTIKINPNTFIEKFFKKEIKFHLETYKNNIKIKIIAPLNEFDLKNTKIKGNKIRKKVEDPIVIAKLYKKLWIVLTAWGPESADSNVFNVSNN